MLLIGAGYLGAQDPIVWAWVLTIPCSAFIAGLSWWIARQVF